MERITKAECYLAIVKMAAEQIDNEVLLRVVSELAFRTADIIGPEPIMLLNDVDIARDAQGNIDRHDRETWKRLVLTAGKIVEAIYRREAKGRTERAHRQRQYIYASHIYNGRPNGRTGT